MSKHIAIYVRVSAVNQDTALQEHDLRKWVEVHADGTSIEWYRDKATGKTMGRPGWQKLEAALSDFGIELSEQGPVQEVMSWNDGLNCVKKRCFESAK